MIPLRIVVALGSATLILGGSPSSGQSKVKSREIAGTNFTGMALRAQDVKSREIAGVNFVGTALRAQEIKSRAIEGTNFIGVPAARAPGTRAPGTP